MRRDFDCFVRAAGGWEALQRLLRTLKVVAEKHACSVANVACRAMLDAPAVATAKWWKEERHGGFVDYNQNARGRTTASAYSVRATPDARVSMPLSWDDFFAANPLDFTLRTVPAMFAARGDAHAGTPAGRAGS